MDETPSLSEALVNLGAEMEPYIEFAEGQKAKLVSRGWTNAAAEKVATEVLQGLYRQFFENWIRGMRK